MTCFEHTILTSGCAACADATLPVEPATPEPAPPPAESPPPPCSHGPAVLCAKCPPEKLVAVIGACERHIANPPPLPMLLWCPECGERHVDRGPFAAEPHHTHACQECGMVWRPAIVPTIGVLFLPGFKTDVSAAMDGAT